MWISVTRWVAIVLTTGWIFVPVATFIFAPVMLRLVSSRGVTVILRRPLSSIVVRRSMIPVILPWWW
jgi:hypothetical protein